MVYPHVYVNFKQTAKQRREKYAYVRRKGFDSYVATRLRDWHKNKIKLFIKHNGHLNERKKNRRNFKETK